MRETKWCPTCGRYIDAWRQDKNVAPWVVTGFFLPVLWAFALYEWTRDLGPWYCQAWGRVLPVPRPVAASAGACRARWCGFAVVLGLILFWAVCCIVYAMVLR
jgi:hypothetical protein